MRWCDGGLAFRNLNLQIKFISHERLGHLLYSQIVLHTERMHVNHLPNLDLKRLLYFKTGTPERSSGPINNRYCTTPHVQGAILAVRREHVGELKIYWSPISGDLLWDSLDGDIRSRLDGSECRLGARTAYTAFLG